MLQQLKTTVESLYKSAEAGEVDVFAVEAELQKAQAQLRKAQANDEKAPGVPGASDSTDSTLHVIGLVQKPDKYAFPVGLEMRLLDAIALAGGRTSQVADTVLVYRSVPGQQDRAVIQSSIRKAKQSAEANLVLVPGDVLSLEPPRSAESRDEEDVPEGNGSSSLVPSKHFGQQTLEAVTLAYNENTRQLRLDLFDPPIPDLTTEQMRTAMLDAAKVYRRAGKPGVASALEQSVEMDRLADTLTFAGMSGTFQPNPDGVSFRQITPAFTFKHNSQVTLVVLSKAELRYSRNGWSSSTWGDIHPPLTGAWELDSIEQQGESRALESFKKEHGSWTVLVIDDNTVSTIGDGIAVYDFAVDYHSGPLPEFRLSQEGKAKYEGVLMGNGFVDDTKLHIAVDIEGKSKPKTFHTDDGRATRLTYRRVQEPQQAKAMPEREQGEERNDAELSTPQATLNYLHRRSFADRADFPAECYTDEALLELSGLMLQNLVMMSGLSQIGAQTGGLLGMDDGVPVVSGGPASFHLHVDALLEKQKEKNPPEVSTKAFELLAKLTLGAVFSEEESLVTPDRQLIRMAAGILRSPKEFIPDASRLVEASFGDGSDEDESKEKNKPAPTYNITIDGDNATATQAGEAEVAESQLTPTIKLRRVNGRWLIDQTLSDDDLAATQRSISDVLGDGLFESEKPGKPADAKISGDAPVADGQRHLVWGNANVVRLSQSFAETLGLAESERTAINTLLTEMWTKYIDLEYEHTKYSRTLNGDLQADIGKFTEARERLTHEFWMKLGEIVPASAREHIFALASAGSQETPSLLGWQEPFYPARVQIRSSGTGFHWFVRPGKHGITGDGKTLPFELAHYLTLGHNKLDGDKRVVPAGNASPPDGSIETQAIE